jgi:hypothetical protein
VTKHEHEQEPELEYEEEPEVEEESGYTIVGVEGKELAAEEPAGGQRVTESG